MIRYEKTYSRAIEALDAALFQLSRSVDPPSVVVTNGSRAYRFTKKSAEQALIIKCVRQLSALKALHCLLGQGLLLDAGSVMRVLDEVDADILFISGPIIHNQPQEPRHKQYLVELFQEEFETKNPQLTRSKRNRVGRKHIRSYIARTFSSAEMREKHIIAQEMLEGVFSGFVHGAGTHVMDVYNGSYFEVQLCSDDPPLQDVIDQFSHYIQRALFAFCYSAKAIGRDDVFDALYRLTAKLFTEHGELR